MTGMKSVFQLCRQNISIPKVYLDFCKLQFKITFFSEDSFNCAKLRYFKEHMGTCHQQHVLLFGEWVDIDWLLFFIDFSFFEVNSGIRQLCALIYISTIFPGHCSVVLRKKVLNLVMSRGKASAEISLCQCGFSMVRLLYPTVKKKHLSYRLSFEPFRKCIDESLDRIYGKCRVVG